SSIPRRVSPSPRRRTTPDRAGASDEAPARPGRGSVRLRSVRRRRTLEWTVVAVVALGATATAAFLVARGGGTSAAAPAWSKVEITTNACAGGWHARHSGHPTVTVVNATDQKYDVELLGADQRTVYAEIETLAAHTTRPLRIALPPGRYSWRCGRVDGTVSLSAVALVTGKPVTDAHPFVPVTYTELAAATTTYPASVRPDT